MKSAALLALICCVVSAASANAKNERARAELDEYAESALRNMASCVAKRHRDAAIQVLGNDPTDPNAAVPLVKLLNANCGNLMPVSFHIKGEVLRGAVAEQLYLQTYKVPPADLRPEPLATATMGEAAQARYAVAACVAARAPLAADAMLRAGRRTSQERAAGAVLAPALNACARTHVDFTGGQLHGALAEALFKLRASGAQGTS